MCGIWDWQSTIVKDLNDSQDPKHTLFCREIVFVAIYALFSDNKCPLFTRLGGGGRPKQTMSAFLTVFFCTRASLIFKCCYQEIQIPSHTGLAKIILSPKEKFKFGSFLFAGGSWFGDKIISLLATQSVGLKYKSEGSEGCL